ncbi:tyrosine-type recombinase/integrase [Nocardia goodfellowii]
MSVNAPDAPLDLFSIEVAVDPLLTGFTALLAGHRDLAPRSRKAYLERVAHFLTWIRETGGLADALHSARGRDRAVDAYLGAAVADRGVAGRTINLSLTALNIFYEWLGLGELPMPRVLVDPVNPHTLELTEQRAVLRAAAARGPRAYALVVLGLDLGPRKSELVDLDLAGVDLAKWPGQLTIPETTGGSRTVPLGPGARTALVAWLPERRRLLRGHEQRALFITEQAPPRRLAQRTLDDAIRAIGHDAGVDLSPGLLRATAEQRMLREGLAPELVATRLGRRGSDRASTLLEQAPRRRTRVPLTDSEQLDLFGDIAEG